MFPRLLFSLSPIHYLFCLTSESIRLPLKANDVKIFLMNAKYALLAVVLASSCGIIFYHFAVSIMYYGVMKNCF